MKIRVIQEPSGDTWTVERREWLLCLFPVWVRQESFRTCYADGDTRAERQARSKQNAIDYATRLANPEIVNIK